MQSLRTYLPYIALLLGAMSLSVLTQQIPLVGELFHTGAAGFYLALALLLLVGAGVHYAAPKTVVPRYVWAVFFGIALQYPLLKVTGNHEVLKMLVELVAAFVLFAAGLHVPTKNFKKYFAPIAALSIFGTLVSVLLFAYALAALTGLFELNIPILSLLVLAAILASIDPGAIIPTLESLHLKKPFLRDIAVAESAMNDVVGTIITRFFLIAALGTAAHVATVSSGFSLLFTKEVVDSFALEVVWGLLVGLLGAWILQSWGESVRKHHWTDPALFFVVPVFAFALGSVVGGSGFLAAFIAGLLFESNSATQTTRAAFDRFVDNFIKPMVFLILGAMVPLDVLVDTLPLGIMAALMFMCIVRPAVVFSSLLPWMINKRATISWREALFLSFVRETGTIPAVLILIAVTAGLAGSAFVFAIGVWVILITLTVEPPLTHLVAKKLELTHWW